MEDIDDLQAKEAMDSIRGSSLSWVLLALVVVVAGALVFWLHGKAEDGAIALAAIESRSKQDSETIDVLKREKGELDKRVLELERVNSELAKARDELTSAVQDKDAQIGQLKSTYDLIQEKMKKEIGAGEVRLSQNGATLQVDLVDKILFDSGDAHISKRGEEVLTRVGAVLAKVEGRQVQVSGHTDNAPISAKLKDQFPTNWELSVARATHVVRFLQEKTGVPERSLVASGYGSFHPVAANTSAEGRARNRRIEILLTPLLRPVEKAMAQRSTIPTSSPSRPRRP